VFNPDYENKTYVTANNTDPYLVPPPADTSFFAGDEFSYKLGYAVDNERDNVEIRVDLGEFADVAAYNRLKKSIDV
jgi:hypothetical protein